MPIHPPSDHILKGVAYICLAMFFFTLMFALGKLLNEQHGPIEVGFYRNSISLIMLLVYMRVRHLPLGLLRTHLPWTMALRVVVGTAGLLLTFAATQMLPLANATVIFFGSVLILPLLAIIFLKETIGPHRWAAIIIGMIGVVIAAQPSLHGTFWGAVIALAAAVSIAIVQLLLRLLRTENPLTVIFYFFAGGVILCGAAMPFVAHPVTWHSAWILLAIGFVGGLGQYFSTSGFQLTPSSVAAPFNYTGLIWATVFDVALWGKIPTWPVYLAAAIIIGAQLYILHREHLHKKSQAPDALLEL